MPSVKRDPRSRRVVIGVDTHKHVHVAVALDDIGGRLDTRSFTADQDGHRQLLDRAAGFGAKQLVFGIEGTGSYGAGRALLRPLPHPVHQHRPSRLTTVGASTP